MRVMPKQRNERAYSRRVESRELPAQPGRRVRRRRHLLIAGAAVVVIAAAIVVIVVATGSSTSKRAGTITSGAVVNGCVIQPNTTCIEADLSRQNLSGAELRGANLSLTNFAGADLSYADLFDANLAGANLSGVDFLGACLCQTNLTGADLSGALLAGAVSMDIVGVPRALPTGYKIIGGKLVAK